MDNTLLRVTNLKTYFFAKRGVVKAVDGIDFELRRGECLCLVGESGCGKTVTALSLLRLVDSPPGKIISGEVKYGNLDLVSCSRKELRQIRGREIAMIFQDSQSALNPVFTIGNQIIEQIKLHLGVETKEARSRAISLLAEVGVPEAERVMNYYPHQLSGGMKQRTMIAMSLSCNPQILIADEPTTAVDVTIKAQIMDIFRHLKEKRQLSLIFITHDFSIVAGIGNRALIMYGGRICETGTVSQILDQPLHPYTIGLLNCLPDISKVETRLTSIPGMTPDPAHLPPGCRFQPRCSQALPVCGQKEPNKTIICEEHSVCCHLYGKL